MLVAAKEFVHGCSGLQGLRMINLNAVLWRSCRPAAEVVQRGDPLVYFCSTSPSSLLSKNYILNLECSISFGGCSWELTDSGGGSSPPELGAELYQE